MKAEFYQVIGSGPWMIDYPNGETISHRPGQVFEARPNNASVIRGLRIQPPRLRQLSEREASALRAASQIEAVPVKPQDKPKVVPPPAPPSPAKSK